LAINDPKQKLAINQLLTMIGTVFEPLFAGSRHVSRAVN